MSCYSLEQIYQEIIRLGKSAEKRPSQISEGSFSYSWSPKDAMIAASKLKSRATKPARYNPRGASDCTSIIYRRNIMGSRNYIGYLNEDGNVTFSYCHRGSQLKYNGRTLLKHFNDEKSAKALAYHGEMASIDGNNGRISKYKNPDTSSTVSLHAYLAWSERDIQSLFIWMHGGWQIKSDYHFDNDKWHVLRDLVFEVGDKVNLVRDNYITSHPRPVWEVRNITQPDDAEIDVYVLRREVLPASFLTEHMRHDEIYRCPPTAENPQTPAPLSERQKDLQARINKLCELSAELELHNQKLMDDNSEVKSLEQQYQDLFRETLLEFGN